jgi:hypothetical protein
MLVSMSLALKGVARMRTRELYNNIGDRRARGAWKKPLLLEEGAARELEFWLKSFDEFNGRPFLDNRKDLMVDVTGFSDASDRGFGGFVRLGEGAQRGAVDEVVRRAERESVGAELRSSMRGVLTRGLEFRGEFTEAQSAKSSTWREAWGVWQLLRFAAGLLRGCVVRMFVDNMGLAFGLGGLVRGFEEGVYGGSKTREIQGIIAEVVDICVREKISLLVEWIPREMNEQADYLSKLTTHYDFTLSDMAFKRVEGLWGPHTIDRFSSDESVRVRSGRYNSRFWRRGMEGCQGIDAFLQDWQGENNWVHPPYKLVGRVVQHMRMQGAQGTVVIVGSGGRSPHRNNGRVETRAVGP